MVSAPYLHDVTACFAERIGEGGLTKDAYARLLHGCGPALEQLRRARADGALPFLTLPSRRDDLGPLATLAARYRGAFDDVVVLGTGGSSLGGQAIAALADRGFGPPVGSPRVHFLDNVDPDTFQALFAAVDPARTGVFAISKSGGTAETLCQLAVVIDRLRAALGEDALKRHVAVMTEPKDSPLSRIAERFSLPHIDHDPGLGGRFSVLSTGMLPALLLGLDTAALRTGAAAVLEQALEAKDAAGAAPAVGAAIQVGLANERMVSQSVLMPYCDRLFWFARWYRQLWAESLGKEGNGTTPVDALGTVDQHSQLQLYLDGPADKLFTLVDAGMAEAGRPVDPDILDHPETGYLQGRTMGELFTAESRATAETLIGYGRPVRQIRVERLDEGTLGALFMHFMLETAIAAHLMGVNAYDQPAVEDGKRLTRRYLQGEGVS
ncbi:glucose-6-phosphate isomerase [Ferruginivarius sediminum]|uniref:Glucose-6-phosphate isomerase n=1 Tax=Ferruginivarius sediminum TaxID=2661937 RepID=A0A369T5E3_9PROT|nr:glucose-6-phosphate isomerase [Ferruginivarius sediminum]